MGEDLDAPKFVAPSGSSPETPHCDGGDGPRDDDARWAEQGRRHDRHVADRRARRRRRALIGFTFTVVAAVLGAAGWSVLMERRQHSVDEVVEAAPASGPRPSVKALVETTVATTRPLSVAITEVWLLARSDGTFDWGAVMSSTASEAHSGLAVTVVFLDAQGDTVETLNETVEYLASGSVTTIGGNVDVGAVVERIDVSSTVGDVAPDGAGSEPSVVDIQRVPSGQVDRDDRLLGSVNIRGNDSGDTTVDEVTVVAAWRDGDGDVVASVAATVGPVTTDRPTPFSIRLDRGIVPSGEPDFVTAAITAA